jgi:hypothetical protein
MSERPMTEEEKIQDLHIQYLQAMRDPFEDRAAERGLTQVWAYHCQRCNYVWLPRDFDLAWYGEPKAHPEATKRGQDLLFREPPKVCARCKSRYWNRFPQRNTFHSNGVDHDMDMAPRLRALHRQGKIGFPLPYCRCKYCKALRSRGKG